MTISFKRVVAPVLFCLAVYGCATRKPATISKNPYELTNKIYEDQARALIAPLGRVPIDSINPGPFPVGTVNFNLRKPNYVILHHTAQNACEQTLNTFLNPKTQVSAHYVICKDGRIHQMLNDYLRAWHAGLGKWGTISDINSVSLGIEIDNNGVEEFTEQQIGSLLDLLARLKKLYNIPASNFIGHSDIAPTRKQDPSVKFPWKRLSEVGFGHWPDSLLDSVPPQFDAIQGLRIIGYDTKDSVAAITAFKRHFIQTDVSPFLSPTDKAVIKNLIPKF
jgi:N-acetylmuramoyl-L-alanine amidase